MITNQPSRLQFKIVSINQNNDLTDCPYVAPKKISSLNARAKKESMQKIAHENQLMLNRLIRGKSTFSVTKWEQSHQER